MGSTTSPTNDFVELATVNAVPAPGMFTELVFVNAKPYRYVKYQGPRGSFGAIAELELYAGSARLTGAGFGVAGSRNDGGNVYAKALDGDTNTFFEGPMPDGDYVGLDLGAGHAAASPTFSPAPGSYDAPVAVTLASPTAAASIRFTTDGTDPAMGALYASPFQVGTGTTTIKAQTSAACMLASPVAQGSYRVGGVATPTNQSVMHIGNSLTDTLVGRLDVVAKSGGITLDFHRFTIPGAGTQWLWEHPTEGLGETNVFDSLKSIRFDQMTVQPFPNEPCSPTGSESDADYVNRFYALARQANPNVLLWIYQQWPTPDAANDCFSVGAPWLSVPWVPPIPNPTTWEDAVSNQLAYQEAVRKGVMDANPGRAVYIVPGGLALRNLKKEVESNHVPGWTDFKKSIFEAGGTDIHLTAPGAWFMTVVFYECMFQKNPAGVSFENAGLTAEQAGVLEQIAWSTANEYALSGVRR
jgi:hypothetical protein